MKWSRNINDKCEANQCEKQEGILEELNDCVSEQVAEGCQDTKRKNKRLFIVLSSIVLVIIIAVISTISVINYNYKNDAKLFLVAACKVERYFSEITNQNLKDCFDANGELKERQSSFLPYDKIENQSPAITTILKYSKFSFAEPPLNNEHMYDTRKAVKGVCFEFSGCLDLLDIGWTDTGITKTQYRNNVKSAKKDFAAAIDKLFEELNLSRADIPLNKYDIEVVDDLPVKEVESLLEEFIKFVSN